MSKFDEEEFYDYCVNLVKDNIGAKITALNAEKADAITLETPGASDYIFDFSVKSATPDFFIYYTMLDAVPLDTVGNQSSIECNILFYFAFIDFEENDYSIRKGMRYTRALREIFLDNFNNNHQISDFEIFQVFPQSAQFQNTKKWYKVGGVEIKGVITV